MKLSYVELQWIVKALEFTADQCREEAKDLTGTLQGLALLAESNNRTTAVKIQQIIENKCKRIEVKA